MKETEIFQEFPKSRDKSAGVSSTFSSSSVLSSPSSLKFTVLKSDRIIGVYTSRILSRSTRRKTVMAMDRVTSMLLVAPAPVGSGGASSGSGSAAGDTVDRVVSEWGNMSSGGESPSHANGSVIDIWRDGEAFQSIYLGYLWISLLLGLPGNILIAVVYVVVRHKRTCDWFIFYLSVYDCAVCLFAVPLYLSIETGAWEASGSDLVCKFEQFTIFTSQFSSVCILGIIAVDRYLKICHPTRRSLNACQARNIGVGTPVLAALVAAPLLFWEGNVDRRFCRIQDRYRHTLGVKIHLCSTLGFFIVTFVLVIFCYSQVCLVVRRRIQRHRENALKRKHLLQIPAFIQAISNVDDPPGGSDPKLSQGRRKFSLFNIGSSRRLSVIAPWVKARLSLPNDSSAGVSSRGSGASSASSLSLNQRKKKKKSVSSSAMVLSEKGESGADEETKDTAFVEKNTKQSVSGSESKTETSAKKSAGGSSKKLCEEVYVQEINLQMSDKNDDVFIQLESPRVPSLLCRQNQVADIGQSFKEFQTISDRGRSLGAAFTFADAPARRSLEEEWELEMARVARERRISTESAMRRPSETGSRNSVTARQSLISWLNKWRRKAFTGQSKGRHQKCDVTRGTLEETETMLQETETSFSTHAQRKTSQSALPRRGSAKGDSHSPYAYTAFQFEVSPSTPKSSLQMIGRQKTSIEEPRYVSEVEACKADRNLLVVDNSDQLQDSSDSTSNCLSLFDHVVCVHQPKSPANQRTQDFQRSPKNENCCSVTEKMKNGHMVSGMELYNCKTTLRVSNSSKDQSAKSFNKSDPLISERENKTIFPEKLSFKKSRSLSPCPSQKTDMNDKQKSFSIENTKSQKDTKHGLNETSAFWLPPVDQQKSFLHETVHPNSRRRQSLPERLKGIFYQSFTSDTASGEVRLTEKSIRRPFSFPVLEPRSTLPSSCNGCAKYRDISRTNFPNARMTRNRIGKHSLNEPYKHGISTGTKDIKEKKSIFQEFHQDENRNSGSIAVDSRAKDCSRTLLTSDKIPETNQSGTSNIRCNEVVQCLNNRTNQKLNCETSYSADASNNEHAMIFSLQASSTVIGDKHISHSSNTKTDYANNHSKRSLSHSPQSAPIENMTSSAADSGHNSIILPTGKDVSLAPDKARSVSTLRCSEQNLLQMPTSTIGQHPNGVYRTLSENSCMDEKGRNSNGSQSLKNPTRLSASFIDMRNSELYQRRMSPTREKHISPAKTDEQVALTGAIIDTVVPEPANKTGDIQENGHARSYVDDTQHKASMYPNNEEGDQLAANKSSENTESPSSSSSASNYASAHTTKSCQDSASASYLSCSSSIASNIFSYAGVKESSETSQSNVKDEKSGVSVSSLNKPIVDTAHIDQHSYANRCPSPTQSMDNVSYHQTLSQTRSHHSSPPMRTNQASRLLTTLNGKSVTNTSRDGHIFKNYTGSHTLYSPPESPPIESTNVAPSASSNCSIDHSTAFHHSDTVPPSVSNSQIHSHSSQHSHLSNANNLLTDKENDIVEEQIAQFQISYNTNQTSHLLKETSMCQLDLKNFSWICQLHARENKTFLQLCEAPLHLNRYFCKLFSSLPLVYKLVDIDHSLCSLCFILQLYHQYLSAVKYPQFIYDISFSLPHHLDTTWLIYPHYQCRQFFCYKSIHLQCLFPSAYSHNTYVNKILLHNFGPIPAIHISQGGDLASLRYLDPTFTKNQSSLYGIEKQSFACAFCTHILQRSFAELKNTNENFQLIDPISIDDGLLPVSPPCHACSSRLESLIQSFPFDTYQMLSDTNSKPMSSDVALLDSKFLFTTKNVFFDCLGKDGFVLSTGSDLGFNQYFDSFTSGWSIWQSKRTKQGLLSWCLEMPVLNACDLLQTGHVSSPTKCFSTPLLEPESIAVKNSAIDTNSNRDENYSESSVTEKKCIGDLLTSQSDVNGIGGHVPVKRENCEKAFSNPGTPNKDSPADRSNSLRNTPTSRGSKKRIWGLPKREGNIFKFHVKPKAPLRSPRQETSAASPGSPLIKAVRTSLRKRAVIAAGIRDSILGETLVSLLPMANHINPKDSSSEDASVSQRQDVDQDHLEPPENETSSPVIPPSSFPGEAFPPMATKAVHSALLKCVPTLVHQEPLQSPSEQQGRYQASTCVSASESVANTPTTAGSATPSSTCEIFVRSIFDAFVTSNGFISSSEPCLPMFTSPGEAMEAGQDGDMPPLDVPLTPLLVRNDIRRKSASNRGADGEEYESGGAAAVLEDASSMTALGSESRLYQLARKNREALLDSTHTFNLDLGSPLGASPAASCATSMTVTNAGGEGAEYSRSRKQSTLSHSWFSLDDLESTRKPSRFRLRSFYYLNSLRHQIERAFSLGHIRSFLGLGEADFRRRKASRKTPRDYLAANQINVIITRCESIVLDRSSEDIGGQPMRDRSSSLDPCPMEMSNGSSCGGGGNSKTSSGVSDRLDQWDKNLPQHAHYQHRHSADAASTASSHNRACFDRMSKPRAASLDTARGSSFSQSDDMSSRGASLDLLSPASASGRTGSVCSGISTLSRLTECSAYTENSRSDCERITRRSAEREHNITKLLGVITFIFVISWSVSWCVIIGDTLGLTPDSSHASVTYSGAGKSDVTSVPLSTSGSGEVSSAMTSPAGGYRTASPATHLTVSLARNLFLVNHFCNIVVYAWLSKSFREKLADCYKIALP